MIIVESESCYLCKGLNQRPKSLDMQLNDLETVLKVNVAFNVYLKCTKTTVYPVRRKQDQHLVNLMNDARKRKFDVVLVWRFDRFAR